MLLTNQHLDKLAAMEADVEARGMLRVPLIQTMESSLLSAHVPTVTESNSTHSLDSDSSLSIDDDSSSESDMAHDSDDDSDADPDIDTVLKELDTVTAVAVLAVRPRE